jgi:hypothetical protein
MDGLANKRTGASPRLPVATTAPIPNMIIVPGISSPTRARDSEKETRKIAP